MLRNPNFLVLDEPTNDLDIQTLQILEEYLQDFPGCVIVVSHDRYFMDKIVDHLLVFKGHGKIKDFPGNYTQYRTWNSLKTKEEQKTDKENIKKKHNIAPIPSSTSVTQPSKRKLTYKEKREYEQLENDINLLEEEQKQIEDLLCSGTLSVDELTTNSIRLPKLKEELDIKVMRWLELSEFNS